MEFKHEWTDIVILKHKLDGLFAMDRRSRQGNNSAWSETLLLPTGMVTFTADFKVIWL